MTTIKQPIQANSLPKTATASSFTKHDSGSSSSSSMPPELKKFLAEAPSSGVPSFSPNLPTTPMPPMLPESGGDSEGADLQQDPYNIPTPDLGARETGVVPNFMKPKPAPESQLKKDPNASSHPPGFNP